jgi:glycosyltransferase involved in cell wall biosynthesis
MNPSTNSSAPLVSVIVPAHNNASTIGIALESLCAQTYSNLEIIVVDDFSTDETRAIAESYTLNDSRIQVFVSDIDDPERFNKKLNRNVNAGWSARNTGLRHATAELITFQDADDASLRNRIETQVQLLQKYNAMHILTGWQPFSSELVGTSLPIDVTSITPTHVPEELFTLSQQCKGIIFKIFPTIGRIIPFHIRRMRILNKIFFGALDPFPGAGNNPLFKREVIQKIQFRKLSERIWPSFMGRGADRDFHFHVSETFRNSYVFEVPLYLWRTTPPL